MATKFSDFTAQAATATAFVVGYDGTTNTQYSQTQLTDFVFDGACLFCIRTFKDFEWITSGLIEEIR